MKTDSITVMESDIHSMGVFASQKIPKGTRVIEYVGERITKAESEIRAESTIESAKKKRHGAVYIFKLDRKYDIDGNVPYNTARYINHSCGPNCEAQDIDGHIWIVAVRDIDKGEEITYDYGYDLDDYEEHPCYCSCKNCVGYIVGEDYRPKLRAKLSRKGRLCGKAQS